MPCLHRMLVGEGARRWAVAQGLAEAAPEVLSGLRGMILPLLEALGALGNGALCPSSTVLIIISVLHKNRMCQCSKDAGNLPVAMSAAQALSCLFRLFAMLKLTWLRSTVTLVSVCLSRKVGCAAHNEASTAIGLLDMVTSIQQGSKLPCRCWLQPESAAPCRPWSQPVAKLSGTCTWQGCWLQSPLPPSCVPSPQRL